MESGYAGFTAWSLAFSGRTDNADRLAVKARVTGRLGFFSTDQMKKVFDEAKATKEITGKWPWESPFISGIVKMTPSGEVY